MLSSNQPIVIRWAVALLTATSLAYVLGLTVLFALLGGGGAAFWWLTPLYFVPQTVWLLPLLVLIPASLALRPSLVIVLLTGAALLCWLHFDFQSNQPAVTEPGDLVLLSNNISNNKSDSKSLKPYLEQQVPNVIALQAGWGKAVHFAQAYPDHEVAWEGPFILISQFTVLESALLELRDWHKHPNAARFVIDYHGQPIAIYNVHLPSPRSDLQHLRGRGLFAEMFDREKGFYSAEVRAQYRANWMKRLELVDQLLEEMENDPLPVLAAGDFNTPSYGMIHQRLAQKHQDAFRQAGRGMGYTFPGDSTNPLALARPWLRLDYIFTDPNWEVRRFQTEPERPSHHRAVVATLRLQKNEP